MAYDNAILKNRLVSAGIVLLALIIAAKLYQGRMQEIERIKAQQEEEHKKNNLLESIQLVEKNLEAYAGVLRDRDEGIVMNTVNTLAAETGLKIESMRPAGEQRYQQYTKTPYLVEARAVSYHVLGQFLAKAESDQSFLIVERLFVQKDSMDKGLIVQLTLSTVTLNQS